MFRLSRIKILPKFVAVIALIGVIVGGCVWYAQSHMSAIDDAYSLFINREAKAVASARLTNRLAFELNYWVYRIIAETEDAQIEPPRVSRRLFGLDQAAKACTSVWA